MGDSGIQSEVTLKTLMQFQIGAVVTKISLTVLLTRVILNSQMDPGE